MIRQFFFSLWLLSPTFAIALTVGDALRVTPTLPSTYGQHNPRVAYDGSSTYLAVWEEGAYVWTNSVKQIYAARLRTQTGPPTVLDPAGIRLAPSSYNQEYARIASNRNNTFLVVWQQFNGMDYDITAATVTSAGTVSGLIPITGEQSHNQITPDVAWDAINSTFIVVWADFRDGLNYRIYGAKVTPGGSVTTIGEMVNYPYHYNDQYRTTTKDNHVLYTPTVAVAGSNLLLAYEDHARLKPYNVTPEVLVDRFALNGTLAGHVITADDNAGSSGYAIQTNYPQYTVGNGNQTAILTDGTDFFVLFRNMARGTIGHTFDTYYAMGTLVKSNGSVPNKPQENIDHNWMAPASSGVYVGGYYYIFWQGIADSYSRWNGKATGAMDYNIYCARVDATTGHVISADYDSPTIISNSPFQELQPAVATDGLNILVLYGEDNNTTWVLKARLLSPNPQKTSLTSFQLSSPNSGTLPFTVGLAFKKGDVPGSISIDLANYQASITRRWNDNSAKTAIVSGTAPLSPNTPLTVHVSTGTPPTGNNLSCADISSTAPTASVQFGSFGTLSLSSLLSSPFRTWFSGPQAVECHYVATLPVSGAYPTTLQLWFYVRLYRDGRTWIRVVAENGYFWATRNDQTYTATVTIGGMRVFHSTIAHYADTRWTAEGWIGGDPAITPKHDTTYLIATTLVPNYSWKNPAQAALTGTYIINGTYNGIRTFTYAPMKGGDWTPQMNDPGFQIDIGLLPLWDALYITSGADSRTYNSVLANAQSLNSYPIAFVYSDTRQPLKPTDLPTAGTGTDVFQKGNLRWSNSHHGSGGYLAYLLTGDYFYLLTMQGQAATINYAYNNGYGSGTSRNFLGGTLQETRAIAWTTRTLAQLCAIGPTGDAITADYQILLANNINNWKSLVDGFGGSGLGYIYAYEIGHASYGTGLLAPWQQHFWIAAMGMGSDIEPLPNMTNWNTVRDWMYRAIVGILGGDGSTGYCFSQAGAYTMTVADSTNNSPSTWYPSWSQVIPSGTTHLISCGSLIIGGADQAYSNYWGNLLPAIAYAVDHGAPGAPDAWRRIIGASNYSNLANGYPGNGDFNNVPIWGVVPRSYQK